MLQGGFFIGGKGSSNGMSEDVYLENGNIIFSPTDPIYVDENNNVFFDDENKNARIYSDGTSIYVEKVI